MPKKTATQLREQARKLMDQAKQAETKTLLQAGKLAKRFQAGKLELAELEGALAQLFGEAPLAKPRASNLKKP